MILANLKHFLEIRFNSYFWEKANQTKYRQKLNIAQSVDTFKTQGSKFMLDEFILRPNHEGDKAFGLFRAVLNAWNGVSLTDHRRTQLTVSKLDQIFAKVKTFKALTDDSLTQEVHMLEN